jgi:2,3-bisphosphoglycerate-dependent phosphoglycerate mutase
MKKMLVKLSIVLFFIGSFASLNATSTAIQKATTIILVRHGEKATDGGNNPELSAEGKQRAERLHSSFPGVTPDAFYSTAYTVRNKH